MAKFSGSAEIRKKQMILFGGLAVGVVAIALGMAMLGDKPKPQAAQKEQITKKAFGAPGEKSSPSDAWRTQESARIQALQEQMVEMKKNMDAEKKESEKKEEEKKKQDEEKEKQRKKAEEEKQSLALKATPPPPPPTSQPGAVPGLPNAAQLGLPGEPALPQQRVGGIVRIDIAKPDATPAPIVAKPGAQPNGARTQQSQQNVGKTNETFLPPGTFLRSINLAGLDAPTGGQVQSNPHPIVFRVVDFAQLPNRFRADYRECFVTAAGFGDISSERALIKLDRMSCISKDGGAIDVAVKGYVAGEDGKAGMRGRLVSKQGQILANSLMAGVASGIGNAFSLQGQSTSTSPLGSTTTVKDGEEFRVGVGQGVGKALDQLAKYYVQLAEKIFPVIEIDAGRQVDIVITQGVSIQR